MTRKSKLMIAGLVAAVRAVPVPRRSGTMTRKSKLMIAGLVAAVSLGVSFGTAPSAMAGHKAAKLSVEQKALKECVTKALDSETLTCVKVWFEEYGEYL